MPKKIYTFETRDVNFLKPYTDKAKSLGFKITITDNSDLKNNSPFEEFLSVYEHLSVNPPEFEIACFARYFAIASLLKNNDPFLITDTDVYLTPLFKNVIELDYRDTFVGSEGFLSNGTLGEISPHCTFWNRELLMNFLQFLTETYKRNDAGGFLGEYHKVKQAKLGVPGVSDMSLLYLWVQANNIPYINSNSPQFVPGIDHNLSSLFCEGDEFLSFAGRKYLKKSGDKITCLLKSGKKLPMALLHFQGSYKPMLKRYYSGKFIKFIHYSVRNNYRQKKRLSSNHIKYSVAK